MIADVLYSIWKLYELPMKFREHTLDQPRAQWSLFDIEEAKKIRKERNGDDD